MDIEKGKLIEINDYYHDQLEKALSVMWQLQEAELKYKLQLPKGIQKEVYEFTDNFRFRYHDREQ